MEIKASSTFDYETYKAFQHASLYKKIRPKTAFIVIMILGAVSIAMTVAAMIIKQSTEDLLTITICVVLLLGLQLYFYFVLPKISFKALGNSQNIVNNFVFTENKILMSSVSDTASGDAEMDYEHIVKVMESEKYIYAYESSRRAFIVDKSTVENGIIENLTYLLTRNPNTKYVKCKY